jgi:hypothetical protein
MPELAMDPRHNDQLTNCSIMLYVMTVRFPSARKYRDVFEDIKTSVRKLSITKSKGQGQHTSKLVATFDDGMRENVRTLETGFGMGGAREEFAWMIGELTGGHSGLAITTSNGEGGDMDTSPRSRVVQNQVTEDTLLFSSNETSSEGVAADTDFDLTIYDYENLGADWPVPEGDGGGPTSERVDFGDWGTAEKV